jgi:hypothetical protein
MTGQVPAGGDQLTVDEVAPSEGQAQAAALPAAGGQPMVGEAAASGVQAEALVGEAAAPTAAGGQPMAGEAAASGVQAEVLVGEAAAPMAAGGGDPMDCGGDPMDWEAASQAEALAGAAAAAGEGEQAPRCWAAARQALQEAMDADSAAAWAHLEVLRGVRARTRAREEVAASRERWQAAQREMAVCWAHVEALTKAPSQKVRPVPCCPTLTNHSPVLHPPFMPP